MATIAFVLIALGGIAFLAGSVFLVITAFRVSTGWGLTVLFLSWLVIPAFIFLFRNWSAARTWFLIAVAGTGVSAAGWFVLAGTETMASGHPEPIVYTAPPEQSNARSPGDVVATTRELDPDPWAPAPAAPTQTPTVVEPAPTKAATSARSPSRKDYRVVSFAELEQFIGEPVTLHLTDGTNSVVFVEEVSSQWVKVARRVGGGTFSYRVARSLIAEVRVRN